MSSDSIVEVRREDPPEFELVKTPPRENSSSRQNSAAVSSLAPSSVTMANSKHDAASKDEANADKNDDKHARRPKDVAFTQQRMKSWQPLLDSRYFTGICLVIGVVFLIVGFVVRNKSNALIELVRVYESHTTDNRKGFLSDGKGLAGVDPSSNLEFVSGCEIGDNPNFMYKQNTSCTIEFEVPLDKGDLQPPVLVHYQVNNFYQNYRAYQMSLDNGQLLGSLTQDAVSAGFCAPLNILQNDQGEDIRINPCGLIANTLFNDVFTLESVVGPDGVPIEGAVMNETGIAWKSDLEWKYRQPEGFTAEPCASLEECSCEGPEWSCTEPYQAPNGTYFRYYYPEDNTTQYLYETYPMVVSPLEGVLNEHFVVWMRVAALPNFRKLYGYIDTVIPAGSVLTFRVQANWAVVQSQSAKALVVSDNYIFGGKNHWMGTMFIVVGGISAVIGVFFSVIQILYPRKLGDRKYLKHKED